METGARFFDIDGQGLSDKSSTLPHMLPPAEPFASAAAKYLNVRSDRPVVVYSVSPFTASARAWWMLRTLGKQDVYVLDGGLAAWKAAGSETTQSDPNDSTLEIVENEDLVLNQSSHEARTKLLRTLPDVLQRVQDDSSVIIDARPEPRFYGRVPEMRKGLRSGHMPGAINVPSSSVIAEDGHLKSRQELKQVFEAQGLSITELAHADISTTCGSGVTAAIVLLALHELGIHAALYDGSWTEYGSSNLHNPVVTN